MQSFRDKLTTGASNCWAPGARLVVAVSGGPDSQVLLDALAMHRSALQIEALWAVGIDHGFRTEAARELDLAEALATQHAIPFHRIAIHVPRRGNRLAAARRARYDALETFARSVQATAIAVAHTATDQLETILLHLCRGSALRGVSGIRPRRGLLVRPLLAFTRDDILTYAACRRLAFAQDPSNRDPRRARARLREHVLPALRQLNAQVEAHAARFAQQAQADEQVLQQQAMRLYQKACRPAGGLDVGPLRKLPDTLAFRVLRTWLQQHDLPAEAATIERLWSARNRTRFALSLGDAEVAFERQTFWCTRLNPYDEVLGIPGDVLIKDFQVNVRAALKPVCLPAGWRQFVASAAESVAFDADRLHFGLRIRGWRAGDRLQPLGINGHIKVGDLFTNAKIPRSLRASWPVLVHGEEVLWVVGLRRGSSAPLSDQTRRVVTVELGGALPWGAC